MGVNELPPIPSEHSLRYQEVHPEWEQWAVFRSLPDAMRFDTILYNNLVGFNNKTIFMPDLQKMINPPTLWAYYLTLP